MFDAMVVDSTRDLTVFLAFFICAQTIGVVFDFFRAIRKAFVCGNLMVAVQDVIFCSFSFFMFSGVLTVLNSGRIRWYELAAIILGLVIYFLLESRYVIKVFDVLMRWVCGVWTLIKKISKKSLQFKKNRL